MKSSEGETVAGLLAHGARSHGERPALIDPNGRTYNYRDLYASVQSGVTGLRAMSLEASARVAVVLPQGPELALVILAVSSTATCVPLNHEYRRADFGYYLARLGISLLITDPGLFPEAVAAARDTKVPVVSSRLEAGVLRFGGGKETRAGAGVGSTALPLPGDTALLLHTSGSTAEPKIVPLSQARVMASARSLASSLELSAADRCLNMMPLFHVGALVDLLLGPLSAGGSVIITRDMAVDSFESALQWRPTWYQGVPAMLQSILATDPARSRSCLRLIRSVSAPLPGKLLRDVETTFGIPVIEIYGMTETAGLICSNPLPPGRRKPGSVGVPVDHEVLILDEAGNRAPVQVTGEVLVRGASVIDHYEGNDALNREQFVAGWLRTGDLGYIDADGYLFLTGRLKELVNRGGEKISPAEIDRHLLEHAAVEQAGTFPAPHPTLGEELHAAVVLRAGTGTDEGELLRFLRGRLAEFKVPRRIHFLGQLPRNASGKLVRAQLPALCGLAAANTGNAVAYAAPDSSLSRTLAGMWQSALGVERVGIDDNFFELGGDSLSATTFIALLRDKLGDGVYVPPLYDFPTIRAIERELNAHSSNATQRLAAAMSGLPVAVYEQVSQAVSAAPGRRKRPDSLITGWNTLGSKPPVFLSAGMDRALVCRLLGADQPVYWMRHLLDLDARSAENTRLLASYYVGEILDIHPAGKIILGGYCEGAKIAAYAAAELEDRGREVALLFLVEQLVPLQYQGRTRLLFARQSNFNPHTKFDAPETAWRKYYRGELGATVLPWQHTEFMEPGCLEQLIAGFQADIDAALSVDPVRDPVAPVEQAAAQQCFSLEHRRVAIEVRCPRCGWGGKSLEIVVQVANLSPVAWQPFDRSGLLLAARWVNRLGHRGKILRRVNIEAAIPPGERRTYRFSIGLPRRPGWWNLDVDLAENGIGLFQEVTACTFYRKVLVLPHWKAFATWLRSRNGGIPEAADK